MPNLSMIGHCNSSFILNSAATLIILIDFFFLHSGGLNSARIRFFHFASLSPGVLDNVMQVQSGPLSSVALCHPYPTQLQPLARKRSTGLELMAAPRVRHSTSDHRQLSVCRYIYTVSGCIYAVTYYLWKNWLLRDYGWL